MAFSRYFIANIYLFGSGMGTIIFNFDQPGSVIGDTKNIDGFGGATGILERVTIKRPVIVLTEAPGALPLALIIRPFRARNFKVTGSRGVAPSFNNTPLQG
jgi:hypothetical protein